MLHQTKIMPAWCTVHPFCASWRHSDTGVGAAAAARGVDTVVMGAGQQNRLARDFEKVSVETDLDARCRQLQSEMDKAVNNSNPEMNSSVLHGGVKLDERDFSKLENHARDGDASNLSGNTVLSSSPVVTHNCFKIGLTRRRGEIIAAVAIIFVNVGHCCDYKINGGALVKLNHSA